MKIQIYGYFNDPMRSIPIVAANWAKVLAKHHEVKVKDYTNLNCRFEFLNDLIGDIPNADMGIYFGYPSYIKTSGNLVAKNKYKIGVFVNETGIKQDEIPYLQDIPWMKICVPSNYCKFMFDRYSRNVIIVNHGFQDIYFDEEDSPEPRDKFTFLYIFQCSPIGGTVERKNLEQLLLAFSMLRKEIKDIQLIIKASSNIPEDVTMIEKKHPGVRFELRYLGLTDLLDLYRSCHVYVNPTRAEGFGMTVLEAMAFGLPVVSGIHTGLTEFLSESNCIPIAYEHKKTDFFRYGINDGPMLRIMAHDIRDAMKEAYQNYSRYDILAREQSRYIRARFNWETVMEGFLKWIQELQS